MIILVYGDMLIVAFVEMAGAYDRGGGSLNDHELYCYVFHLTVQGRQSTMTGTRSVAVDVVYAIISLIRGTCPHASSDFFDTGC